LDDKEQGMGVLNAYIEVLSSSFKNPLFQLEALYLL